jgi:hypothetical protein
VRELGPEEADALIDGLAQHYLGMTGDEFRRMWEAGEFDDNPDRPEVMRIAILLPALGSSRTRIGSLSFPQGKRPGIYRENVRLEHSGPGGGPITSVEIPADADRAAEVAGILASVPGAIPAAPVVSGNGHHGG